MKDFCPYLKIKRNRKWSKRVAWEYFTLRNSLALTVSVSVVRCTKIDALKASQDFIAENGIGNLFLPAAYNYETKKIHYA